MESRLDSCNESPDILHSMISSSVSLIVYQLLRDEQGGVRGIATADQGVGKDGQPKSSFARGMELVARQTLLAEGCRGSLSEEAISTFKLREAVDADPQTYALGLKEVRRHI